MTEKYVCSACVFDSILAATVEEASEELPCSYCGQPRAAPLEVLVDAVTDVIGWHHTDPANELPYESREGGYQGAVYDGAELVYDMESWTDKDALLDDVATELATTAWCKRDYFALDDSDQLDFGWRDFVALVKHHTRFFFHYELGKGEPPEVEGIAPGRMLAVLDRLFHEHDLFCTLTVGTKIYRVRVVDRGDVPTGVTGIGSPPSAKARANRMSPAGIPMFYAARDRDTALLETFEPTRREGKELAIGTFVAARELRLLDLTEIPPLPSQFDVEHRHRRIPLSFLRAFADDLTAPVARDGTEHIDYVPTQVVTEYVRRRMRTPSDEALDGIAYESSRPGGKVALVIFASTEQCGPRDRAPYDPECLVTLETISALNPDEVVHLWTRRLNAQAPGEA